MNEEVKKYIDKYSDDIKDLFNTLRGLIYSSVSTDIVETMWARIPTYYVGDVFVRLIPFKDHINIEAKSIINYKDNLTNYKITPKGMLQIYLNQEVPQILKEVFVSTLRK